MMIRSTKRYLSNLQKRIDQIDDRIHFYKDMKSRLRSNDTPVITRAIVYVLADLETKQTRLQAILLSKMRQLSSTEQGRLRSGLRRTLSAYSSLDAWRQMLRYFLARLAQSPVLQSMSASTSFGPSERRLATMSATQVRRTSLRCNAMSGSVANIVSETLINHELSGSVDNADARPHLWPACFWSGPEAAIAPTE